MDVVPQSGGPGSRFGRYQIIARLAAGGMGEVFVARSSGAAGFTKHVVIKKLLPHLVEQPNIVDSLVQEAKLMVRLDHPNIVQVLDLDQVGGTYFMAMEFVQGYNLSALIGYCARNKLVLPAPVCAYICMEVLAGLSYLHAQTGADGQRENIVHRDISPQNVLISGEGRVKLTDFGIAKVLQEAGAEITQSIKGKLRYMAPEALNQGRVDHRYDLFAMGIVLFETLCRVHLFSAKNDAELVQKVQKAEVPAMLPYHPGLPEPYQALVRHSLAADPNRRFQSADEFRTALRRVMRPATQEETSAQLRGIIREIYDQPDFPLNKPKLPDLSSVPDMPLDPSITTGPGLALAEGDPSAISMVTAAPAAPQRRFSPLILMLTLGLLLISGVVSYLAYAILVKGRRADDGETAPRIIIEDRSRGTKPVARKTPDAAVMAKAPKPDARRAAVIKPKPRPRPRPRPRPEAKPFSSEQGARVFRKHNKAISACFNTHLKPGTPGVSLRITSTIAGNGKVTSVRLTPADQADTPVGKCLAKVARRIRYPRHDKPSVHFIQPIRVSLGK